MSQNKNDIKNNELKTLLKMHQLEWLVKGNERSKGFVEGVEYMLKRNGELEEGLLK